MKISTSLIHQHNVKHESGAVTAPLVMATTFERVQFKTSQLVV